MSESALFVQRDSCHATASARLGLTPYLRAVAATTSWVRRRSADRPSVMLDLEARAGQEDQRLVDKEELHEQRRAAEQEGEPLGRLAQPFRGARLAQCHRDGEEEAEEKGQGSEVDVPNEARGDQEHLIADIDLKPAGQDPVAEVSPERAQDQAAEALGAGGEIDAHAAAFLSASPPAVACPRLRRTISRSKTFWLLQVSVR